MSYDHEITRPVLMTVLTEDEALPHPDRGRDFWREALGSWGLTEEMFLIRGRKLHSREDDFMGYRNGEWQIRYFDDDPFWRLEHIERLPIEMVGDRLLTQDNRSTRDPMFCVQVLERHGPLIPGYETDDEHLVFHSSVDVENFYADGPSPEYWKDLLEKYRSGNLPDYIAVGGFIESWRTVQVCFTEGGCQAYLDLDGHNLRGYFGHRIYVESFHRNPEMTMIREHLMEGARKGSRPSGGE